MAPAAAASEAAAATVSTAPSVAACLLLSPPLRSISVDAESSPSADVEGKEKERGRKKKRRIRKERSRCVSLPPSIQCAECSVYLTMEPLYATVNRRRRTEQNHPHPSMIRFRTFQEELESRYGGREVAHAAAAAIQRWYRAARLQKSFSKLMELAMSSDRLDRRLSLLGPDGSSTQHLQMVQPHQSSFTPIDYSVSPATKLRNAEENIDRLILEAAGLMKNCTVSNNGSSKGGPSARHIRNRRGGSQAQLRRSLSMKADPRQTQQVHQQRQQEPISRDDLDLPPSPVPPCPPLRGEVLYGGSKAVTHQDGVLDPIYVTRDDLYTQQQQQQQQQYYALEQQPQQHALLQQQQQEQWHTQTLPHQRPRPPQRTVSFLVGNTLPRKLSQGAVQAHQQQQQQQQQQHRVFSDSDLRQGATVKQIVLEGRGSTSNIYSQQQQQRQHLQQQHPPQFQSLHARSYSSPAPLSPARKQQQHNLIVDVQNTSNEADTPLPPPPYISPPTDRIKQIEQPQKSSPEFLPPPPAELMPSPALPPPPPQTVCQPHPRPPCDSASTSSSIDSGYGRSSVGQQDGNPQQQQQQVTWAPNFVSSPVVSDAVFEPRPEEQQHQQQHQVEVFSHIIPKQQQQHRPQLSVVSLQQQQQQLIHRNAMSHSRSHSVFNNANSHFQQQQQQQQQQIMNDGSESPKVKKTVRILTPEQQQQDEVDRQNLENQRQMLQQQQQQRQQGLQRNPSMTAAAPSSSSSSSSNLVEEDVFRRRQYRVGLNLFNQVRAKVFFASRAWMGERFN